MLLLAFQIILMVYSTNTESMKAIPRSCLDHLKNGASINGFYTVAGPSGDTVTVYCDFISEPGSAWTLVNSWSLENKDLAAFRSSPFSFDVPVNKRTPNWVAYRQSKAQMVYLQSHSTHWRANCSFDKFKVDYRDYMRGNFQNFDIMSYLGYGICKKVEYINIRGHARYHVTAPFWQTKNAYTLHVDSTANTCQYGGAARGGSVSSENNFGFYANSQSDVNPKFRCTSGPSATTQYWFGGYL